jgi:hypothetical protein
MKAYGNHFRIENSKSLLLNTYDSVIALIFDQPTLDATNIYVNYVGVLKGVFRFDYGPM